MRRLKGFKWRVRCIGIIRIINYNISIGKVSIKKSSNNNNNNNIACPEQNNCS